MSKKPGWREIPIGTVLTEAGSSVKLKTGSWRAYRPIIDHTKCVRCLMCWLFCPDFSVKISEKEGKVERVDIDYDYCKGCGICAEVCPTKAIRMEPEVSG
ncbi:MAG: ferredoxin [Thermoprotei archaeon]|nr:MAG: ferredoxin [Thermoprotei archaeon]RLF25155.1 MAG: ferredoxin [Thermoprotei archaeon]